MRVYYQSILGDIDAGCFMSKSEDLLCLLNKIGFGK